MKSRHSPQTPLRDSGNLSVTLTLSSEAAKDIVGVLKNLATVLNIAPPASYKITERIPPNKINPFGNKFSEDIEGGNTFSLKLMFTVVYQYTKICFLIFFSVELEKYLGGAIKYCLHCKIPVSANSSVKKKASEVPFIVQDGLNEDLLFCSTSCYLQMLLLIPPVISEHKVSYY